MEKPVVVQESPYATDLEEGKSYWWCACGKSATQTFGDGTHSILD
ncbi:MAG: hypothetical protein AAF942_04725 [Pseudomonadota bacterium]